MSEEQRVRYLVIKAFKYGNRIYQPGEEFIPGGGKFDDAIIGNGTHVTRERSRRAVKAKTAKARKTTTVPRAPGGKGGA